MDDKIVFLGSGGGRKITASQMRATGGFVVQSKGEQIHFDPGPGAIVRASQYGVDVKATTVIIISHFHIDHSNDVNILIDAITFGGKEKKGLLISCRLCKDNNITRFHAKVLKRHVKMKLGDNFDFRGLKFRATKTRGHGGDPIGYKALINNFVLGYTSDTSFFPELVKEFEGCDVLVVNTLKPKHIVLKGHMNTEDATKLIGGVKPKLAIIQHFGKSMIEADPAKEAVVIEKSSGVKTIAAQDGMVLKISDYVSKKS